MADDDDDDVIIPLPHKTDPQSSSKFYTHFLFKSLVILLFLFLVPLQAPDFISKTLFNRSWEILHLVLAGIAVSYGLFSRKNPDSILQKPDFDSKSSSGYVRRTLLHVSSVFDCDNDDGGDDGLVSGYCVVDGVRDCDELDGEKEGLILPVRRLKSRVSSDRLDVGLGDSRVSWLLPNRCDSKSRVSRERSEKARYDDGGDDDDADDDDALNSAVGVNSKGFGDYVYGEGRVTIDGFVSSTLDGRLARKEGNRSLNSRVGVGFVDGDHGVSVSLFPRCTSYAGSLDVLGDSGKKNVTDGEFGASNVEMARESTEGNVVPPSSFRQQARPSRIERREELEGSEPESYFRCQSSWLATSEAAAGRSLDKPPVVKPVQQKGYRRSEGSESKDYDQGFRQDLQYRGNKKVVAAKARSQNGSSYLGRSVRTRRANEVITASSMTDSKTRGNGIGNKDGMRSVRSKSMNTRDENAFRVPVSLGYAKDTTDILEHILEETDDDYDDDGNEGRSGQENKSATPVEDAFSDGVTDEGPDVDKKADEFIAKFREQIRLQRIESIKSSIGLI